MAFLTTKFTLAKDPNAVQTKTGTPMATGYGFAKLKGNDTPDLGLSVVAFGSVAEALLNHQKGQTVQISGDLEIRVYQNREGQQVEQLQITLDMLVSAKNTQPARRGDSQQRNTQPAGGHYSGQQTPPNPTQQGFDHGHYNAQQPPQGPMNQYNNDMAFQTRPNQAAPQMQPPMQANQFADDDINF